MKQNLSIDLWIKPMTQIMSQKNILFVLLIVFQCTFANAQHYENIKIQGVILDSIDSQPLNYVTVKFLNNKTDSLVTYAISDSIGEYSATLRSIKNIKAVFQYVGYKSKEILLDNDFVLSKHKVKLSQDVLMLDAISVIGRIPKYKSHADGYVVQVQNTLLSASAHALETLSKIPKVQVSNNSISVLGAGKADIYLNGVLLHSTAVLESMLASEIKEIKVVDTPGANYSSHTAAVIEITSTEQKARGWGVGMQTISAKGDGWRQTYAPSLNITGKTVSASASYNFRTADYLYDESYVRIYHDTKINNNIKTESKLRNSNYWRGTLNIHPNKNHFVAIQSIGSIDTKIEDVLNYTYFNSNIDNKEVSKQYGDIHRKSFINNVMYKYSAPSGKIMISTIYDNSYFSYKKDFIINESMDYLSNINNIQNNINSLKINSKFNFAPKWTIDAGSQGVAAYNHNISKLNDDLIDSKLNDLNIAAFASIERKTDKWSYGLSARYEYNQQTISNKNDKITSNVFPSAHISYRFANDWGINARYVNQMYRPTYQDLDPSKIYIDKYAYFQGNPELVPEIHHRVKLELDYKKFATLGVSYNNKSNTLAWIVMQDSENPNVSKATQINTDKTSTISIDAVLPYENKWFSGYIATGLIHNQSKYFEEGIDDLNNTMYYVQSSLNFSLPKNFKIGTELKYTSKGLENIFLFDPIFRWDISLKKSFFNEMLSFTLAWKDILKTDKMNTYTQYNNSFIGYNYYSDKSIIQLTVSFRIIKNEIKTLDIKNSIPNYLDRIKNY